MMIPAQNQPALSVCPFEIFSKMSGMFCELVRALILSSYLPVPTGTLETRSRPGELIYRDYGFTIFTPCPHSAESGQGNLLVSGRCFRSFENERGWHLTPKVGFVYTVVPETPPNVVEHISAIREAIWGLGLAEFNLAERTMVPLFERNRAPRHWVLHNTVTYSVRALRQILSTIYYSYHDPVIHLLKQDEHVAPFRFDQIFTEFSVASVFSYLPPAEIPVVYPNSVAAGISFQKTYVAYVTAGLASRELQPLPETYSASYRGSYQPVSLGNLGQDKADIPTRAIDNLPADCHWRLDVSSKLERRVYGEKWFDLLNQSFAVISSESGSNCFDLDGSLIRLTAEFERLHGTFTFSDLDTYNRYASTVLRDYEGNVRGGTFAPRNLEAAVLGRPQILIEGRYDDLFEESETAVFIRRDFSNFGDALDRLEDRNFARRLGKNSRETVLDNPQLRMSNLTNLILESIALHEPPSALDSGINPGESSRLRTNRPSPPTQSRLSRLSFYLRFHGLLLLKKVLFLVPSSLRVRLSLRLGRNN